MTILQKQCLLKYLGLYEGNIDDIWGPLSIQATGKFQKQYGLPVDNVFGSQVEKRILEVIGSYEFEATTYTEPVSDLWDGIKYWSPDELKCRCGEYHTPYCDGFPVQPNRTLLEVVDDIREHFGVPAYRSSGIRCRQHNIDEGGAEKSRHCDGKALDFYVSGHSAAEVLAVAQRDSRVRYAYAINSQYVHVDVY